MADPSAIPRKKKQVYSKMSTDGISDVCQSFNVPWRSILLNSLIMDNLLEYLTARDLMAFRLTSPQVNEMIITNKSFVKKIILVLSSDKSSTDMLKCGKIKWKHVKVIFDENPWAEFPDEKELKFCYESMQLCLSKSRLLTDVKLPWILQKPSYNSKVVDLTIDATLFANIPSLLANFPKDLKKIYIRNNGSILTNFPPTEDNFNSLADTFKELDTISFECNFDSIFDDIVTTTLVNVLQSNSVPLTNLTLATVVQGMQNIDLPSLKHLKMSIKLFEVCPANKFLNNQTVSQLESLSITLIQTLPPNSIRILFQTVSKWKKSLKELKFSTRNLDATDWSFLSQFQALETFSFTNSNNDGSEKQDIRNFSQGLKSLSLRGISLKDNIIDLFSDSLYQSICELSLEECQPMLKDTEMLIIFSKMTNLTKLEITCSEMSDFGMTGIPPAYFNLDPLGISISNLQKLRNLKLHLCPAISVAIQDSMKFPSLKILNLEQNRGLSITEDFVSSLVKNNPHLEIFYFGAASVPGYYNAGSREGQLQLIAALRSSAGKCSLIIN